MKSKITSKNFKLCYPILEDNISSFEKKVSTFSKEKNVYIELRIDYLLKKNIPIDKIILSINRLCEKYKRLEFIATIRTEGEDLHLSNSIYFDYIFFIYFLTDVKIIDVEFAYYKKDKKKYDRLFALGKKKVIFSTHIFDKIFSVNKYDKLYRETKIVDRGIIKFAVKVYSKKDLYLFMNKSREYSLDVDTKKKECIFIAMGENGMVSRIFPEYTNTKIVFVSAYSGKHNSLGQLDKNTYLKYRKLLAKRLEN